MSSLMKCFYKGLDDIFERNDIKSARNYLESWLDIARKNEDLYLETAVCNELGGVYRVHGETKKASELYDRALENLFRTGQADSENYAVTLINAGDVYIVTGEHERALDYFIRAEEMLIRLGLEGDYRMAALCNNISMVYRSCGKTGEAEKALDKAFNIIKGLPQCRQEAATTLVNLGELQIRQNKLTMAEDSFLRAAEIYENEFGGRDIHLPSAYSGLGQLYYIEKKYDASLMYYEKAMAVLESLAGKTEAYGILERNAQTVREAMVNGR